ncbi:unnamed protein product [Owenia fusiformis]|uniref:Major facilitator superfamily (MFS) profile domain-containing protein n=1 Tax=Owenia fusiformis TaxID=6347 RepID=A0A8S4N2F8_OWEFU|nr:unnamed protein product [Owenia fusiformis]
MDLDDALEKIGGYGRFQMLIYVLMGLVNMRGCAFLLGIAFIGHEPPHHCKLPDGVNTSSAIPLVYKPDGTSHLAKCEMYNNASIDNSTIPCPNGYQYYLRPGMTTVVAEWDLVCRKNYLVELSTSVFMAGLMAGSLFISPLSDKFGRKHLLLIYMWIQTIIAFSMAFTTDYIQFIVLRFFIGALNRGIAIISYVLVTEVFPPKHRTLPGISLQMFWAAGYMLLALLGYFIPNWRHLEMVISLPTLLMISYYWLLPESMRWLLAKDRVEEAEVILQRAAKMNKAHLPPNCLSQHEPLEMKDTEAQTMLTNFEQKPRVRNEECNAPIDVDNMQNGTEPLLDKNIKLSQSDDPTGSDIGDGLSKPGANDTDLSKENVKDDKGSGDAATPLIVDTPSNPTEQESQIDEHRSDSLTRPRKSGFLLMLDLFRTPIMRRYTLIVWYLWMVNALDYYGISLSSSALHGNMYINFFLSGLVEVPAYIICMFALERFGRRKCICAFHLISGLANIITVFLPKTTANGTDLWPLITTLVMIGKFGITGSFCSIYLYSAELFPTAIRNTAIGVSAFWDTVGGMSASFIIYKGKFVEWLPRCVFGTLSITAGLLTLLLPETVNRPLPETIQEVEQFDKGLIEIVLPCARKHEKRNKYKISE